MSSCVGVVGLGVMGSSLALNIAEKMCEPVRCSEALCAQSPMALACTLLRSPNPISPAPCMWRHRWDVGSVLSRFIRRRHQPF